MSTIIHIPEPCHENWNDMQPAEQGRHCNACCKTVIDFTTWEPGDISKYLSDHANRKTCGRFYKTQLEVPVPTTHHEWTERIYRSSLTGFRKIAAVIIVVFSIMGTSCQKPMIDKAVHHLFQPEPGVIVGGLVVPVLIGDTVMGERSAILPVCGKGTIPVQDTTAEPNLMLGKRNSPNPM